MFKEIKKRVEVQVHNFQNKLCGSYLNEESASTGILQKNDHKIQIKVDQDKNINKKVDKDELYNIMKKEEFKIELIFK